MPAVRYSRGRNIHDARPQQREVESFEALVAALDADRAPRKDGAGFVCGPLTGDGRRCAENAAPRAVLAVDLDRIDADKLPDVRMWFAGFSGCAWPTHSSKPEAPRERVLLELDREATREEAMAVGRTLAADLAAEFGAAVMLDPSTFRGEQPVFLPPPGVPLARFLGEPLGVDKYIADAPPVAHPAPRIDAETGEIFDRVLAGGRHEHLVRWAAQMNWRGMPEEAVHVALQAENLRVCEPPKTFEEVKAIADDVMRRYASQHARDAAERQGEARETALARTGPLFEVVSLSDFEENPPAPPEYWWAGYLPAGMVTLLGAHGGTGKSLLALMLSVCIALGLDLFGVPTRRGRVAFFSGEDGAALVRHRLQWICQKLGIDVSALEGQLHILDATAGDPALFQEVAERGRRQGLTTPSYAALRAYLDEHGIDVLIVDNASDTFDASEIDRARVRGFMRALMLIAQERAGAVLLLAHVDKGTSRGDRTGTEGYSGSTAWHNSARSRLYLSRDKDGTLLLEHQKHNLGKLAEPLRLVWPEGGLPQVDVPLQGIVQHIADRNNVRDMLKALQAAYARGEWVSTDTRSRYHAAKVLADEPAYPRCKAPEAFRLLRDAEHAGLVERERYRDRSRREAERWKLTPEGLHHIGFAASAASAASTEPAATRAPDARACASAASAALGGTGDVRAAELAAEVGP